MTFVIVTHVPHFLINNQYFAYAPYVREINIWTKFVTRVIIIAPLVNINLTSIHCEYTHQNIEFVNVDSFDILDFKSILKTIIKLPKISFRIFKAFKKSNHIHLRCPGNMGLLGSIIQIFFPSVVKTAKYAGNWDPKARNPWSYDLQKLILSNKLLSKKMKILVYGEWVNQTINVKPFFTATYYETDKQEISIRNFDNTIHFLFVGTLTSGKNPFYAMTIIEKLVLKYPNIHLSIFGDGILKESIHDYIKLHQLENTVTLKGNQNLETLKKAYQESHFIILPSESEGWPKVVAESMFWGCLPISNAVSCVPKMLDYGNRGILLDMTLQRDVEQIYSLLNNLLLYRKKAQNAALWSRKYTLDLFELEIKKLLLQS